MGKWIRNVEWSSVIYKIFKAVCVIAIFVGLIYYLVSCSDNEEQNRQDAYDKAYETGYESGYEAGSEAGRNAVIENPGEYDLVDPAEMIVSIIDAGYEDFAREIWGDVVVDKIYYGIEPSIDPNLFSNSNN